MEISRRFLLACALWCFLDQVHSVSHRFNLGSSQCEPTETRVSSRECPSLSSLHLKPRRNSLKNAVSRIKLCGRDFRGPKICCPSTIPSAAAAGDFSKCGISKKVRMLNKVIQIVGGDSSSLGNWPWMAALFTPLKVNVKPEYACGASLISRQWVITAGHCVIRDKDADVLEVRDPSEVTVRLGDLNLDNNVQDGASPIDAEVDRIVPHPKFLLKPVVVNDIALIHLRKPVNFTANIRPICLPIAKEYRRNEFYHGQNAYTVGWGATEFGLNSSSALLEIEVPVVENEECAFVYSDVKDVLVDNKIVCAGIPGKGTCFGDSGGPLKFLNETEGRFYLGGLTSGGYECDTSLFPTRFTKVAPYMWWIRGVTGEKF